MTNYQSKTSDRCSHCALSKLCFADSNNADHLKRLVTRHQTLDKDQPLYRQGDDCAQIMVIQSGAIKLSLSVANQPDQITEVLFPGDYVGLDSMFSRKHTTSAIALERSRLCIIPTERLLDNREDSMLLLARSVSSLHWHQVLPRFTATARLAQFLLRLADNNQARGVSRTHLNLSLSRTDIANYLMIALETVSRSLKTLSQEGAISVSGKEITITEPALLKQLAQYDSALVDEV